MMLACIYNLIIGPIELILEMIYRFLILVVRNNYGFAVLGISLIVSFFCLPLYLNAEKLQEKERLLQQKMAKKIAAIKANFKKDEKYMILSMYYRENHYHPIMALRSSLSLLIQIPFFIAAYHFLSHFEPLRGESFFLIRNLGAPDALLSIGPLTINILPILMTLINVVSGIIYSRGFPPKEKIQLYAMALFFLVVLYNSPSALVLYWTGNNVFSLIKNSVLKSKHSSIISYILIAFLLICSCLYVIIFRRTGRSNYLSFVLAAAGISLFILSIPIIEKLIFKWARKSFSFLKYEENRLKFLFVLSCLAFGILAGIFIPFNVVASDPGEFSFIKNASPFNILIPPLFVSLGLFCFWPLYVFSLGNIRIRAIGSFIMLFISLFGTINVFLFSGNYGMVSQTLSFASGTNFLVSNIFLVKNCIAGIVVFLVLFIMYRFNKLQYLLAVFSFILFAVSSLSILKSIEIQHGYISHKSVVESNQNTVVQLSQDETTTRNNTTLEPEISLSKNGKNVLIVMLDKAAGIYFKNIINEHTELKSFFEGFIYYPNTASFFRSTILGAPPLFGGYEYTPEKLHKRNKELMKDKHNESCLVLPELFKQNGYAVSIFDMPYINYQSEMDISFYTSKGIYANNLEGKYTENFINDLGSSAPAKGVQTDLILKHNFTVFGIFSVSLVLLRKNIYDKGRYWAAINNSRMDVVAGRPLHNYAVLHYLPELTDTKNEIDTFTIFVSNMTHDPSFLQYPGYTVTSEISDFGPDLFNGNTNSFQHYHVNAASYLLLAQWFNFLKEEDVYNNTRIIIVSDHSDILVDPDNSLDKEYTSFNPILLFKDFNSTGELITDNYFMTNADVPLLAVENLIQDAKNPFTGNAFTSEKKEGIDVYLGGSAMPQDYTGVEALEKNASFYHVKDNIFNKNNWTKITKRF